MMVRKMIIEIKVGSYVSYVSGKRKIYGIVRMISEHVAEVYTTNHKTILLHPKLLKLEVGVK